jgi:STE24 endopeptidase
MVAGCLRSEAGATEPEETKARAYVAQIRADYTAENRAYATTRAVLGFIEPLYAIAVGLLLLFSGISARVRDVAAAWATGRYGRILIFFVLYSLIAYALSFPLTWYHDYAVEHRFHFSNQTWMQWLGDEGKGLAIAIVSFGFTGLVALAYLGIEKSPRRWWMWLALGTLPVVVFATLIEPLVFDPLFNKFTPLRDQALRSEIVALAEKAGIPGRKVYQVDKSTQTKKYNAYVNGFGASQRIVLWDTILKGMKRDEILFVMGHEMGHYRLGHIWKGIVCFSLLSVGLFYFSWWIMNWAVRRFGKRWGFHALHDPASMPLLATTLTLASLIAQPLVNVYGRATEHEADQFGLEVTRLNDAAARSFIKLGSQNKSDPEPPQLVKWFHYDHPPLVERVRYAIEYQPWAYGQPLRFFPERQ